MELNRKIKVLFRHRSMEMGGVEKVMLSIMNNLNKDLFDVTACITLHQGELRNEIPKHVRKVFLAKGKEDMSKNPVVQKIQLYQRRIYLEKLKKQPFIIDEKILKDQYDIEIGMTYNDFELVLNSSNKKSKKVGWFHSEINLPKLQPLVPKILDEFPKMDYMIYCSQRTQDLMHQYYPHLSYPNESVIINAIPIEEIKEKAKEKITHSFVDKPVFVSIGRLHSRKGYHKLIEAHDQLIKEGLQHSIIIVGDGEEKERLKKMIKERQIEDSFILAGNQMNPYPYLQNADFFIMPSESEAWPLVLAEALILQKPCIATDTGDVASMLDHKKTGLLISYDTQEMYKAMKTFLTDKDLIQTFKNNLQTIESKFDNEKIFKGVEEILLNLAKDK